MEQATERGHELQREQIEPLLAEKHRNPGDFSLSAGMAIAGQIIGRRRTVFAAIPVATIRPNPKQPRQVFHPDTLRELAESIQTRGVLQPIIVRRETDGGYTLIAGERRLRAAELAGLRLVPAILSDDDLLEVALEENIQREDLTPLEEAEALAALAVERNLSHLELAEIIHKSRPYVSNTLALTRLPSDVKREYFNEHAEVPREIMIAIARQENPEAMRTLWKRVKLQQLSVRSFRSEQEKQAASVRKLGTGILLAARRLSRALRIPSLPADLSQEEIARLRRALLRARRGIDKILSTLGGETRDERLAG